MSLRDGDPYQVLGLASSASVSDVKRAYRRLVKQFHPDSAGDGALARFLAIQAAYETIAATRSTSVRASSGGSRSGPQRRRAWEADPDRARATRDAYGEARRARAGRSGAGDPGGAGGAKRARGASAATAAARTATLGSTSYDEATGIPSEPSWEGASWYGPSSGTYWTMNPKEFANPRKHGLDYLRRTGGAEDEPARSRAGSAGRRAAPSETPTPRVTRGGLVGLVGRLRARLTGRVP